MKKFLSLVCAALICAACLGLVACGGSSAPRDDAESAADAAKNVSSDLKAAGNDLLAAVDDLVAFAEKAVDAGSFDAASQEYQDIKTHFETMSEKISEWTNQLDALSDADRDYVKQVILPALAKGGSALTDLLGLL